VGGDDTAGDAELVERLRAGDEAAFASLVARHQGQLLRLATSLVPSRAVAEEVVQDTWLGVVRGIERFEGRASVRTWLFRILVNRARSAGAREHRSVPVDLRDEGPEPAVAPGRFGRDGSWAAPPEAWIDEADERISAEALAGRIGPLLPALPEAQRQVLLLRDVEGLAADEVCNLLGISAGNQRVLLHRARSHMRGMLEAEMGKV
jgi:RNA polymerase sigma-70 factor, ECF subfamily